MSTKILKWAALAFACLALVAGGLQTWAFATAGGPRHLIVGVFAISVGASVLMAVIRGVRPGQDPWT